MMTGYLDQTSLAQPSYVALGAGTTLIDSASQKRIGVGNVSVRINNTKQILVVRLQIAVTVTSVTTDSLIVSCDITGYGVDTTSTPAVTGPAGSMFSYYAELERTGITPGVVNVTPYGFLQNFVSGVFTVDNVRSRLYVEIR